TLMRPVDEVFHPTDKAPVLAVNVETYELEPVILVLFEPLQLFHVDEDFGAPHLLGVLYRIHALELHYRGALVEPAAAYRKLLRLTRIFPVYVNIIDAGKVVRPPAERHQYYLSLKT